MLFNFSFAFQLKRSVLKAERNPLPRHKGLVILLFICFLFLPAPPAPTPSQTGEVGPSETTSIQTWRFDHLRRRLRLACLCSLGCPCGLGCLFGWGCSCGLGGPFGWGCLCGLGGPLGCGWLCGLAFFTRAAGAGPAGHQRQAPCMQLKQHKGGKGVSEVLLLNIHGGQKAYYGCRQKSETSKLAPTWKTKAAVDRCQKNRMLRQCLSGIARQPPHHTTAVPTATQNRVTMSIAPPLGNNWSKRSPTLSQHHLPALDLFWASFFMRVQLTSLLLISPGLSCRKGGVL